MEISTTVTGLEETVAFLEQFDTQLTVAGVEAVRVTSDDVRDDIQEIMPVDTGWAQARWGDEIYGGIWRIDTDGLGITQGSSIDPYEYIEKLNEGSSMQAPAGFIDAAAERGRLKLESNLEREIGEVVG